MQRFGAHGYSSFFASSSRGMCSSPPAGVLTSPISDRARILHEAHRHQVGLGAIAQISFARQANDSSSLFDSAHSGGHRARHEDGSGRGSHMFLPGNQRKVDAVKLCNATYCTAHSKLTW